MNDPTKCFDCPIRKFYARRFDIHIDYRDCWVECPHDRIIPVEEEKETTSNDPSN